MRCLILDDYQDVASTSADWDSLDGVEVVTVGHHEDDHDRLVELLAGAQIVVAMRERTPFPAVLLERLGDLRLLVTTGRRNLSIDVAAATRLGITVCGTDSSPHPPVELTWALILGLARNLLEESTALRAGGAWQSTVGADLAGRTLGVVGLGRLGARVAEIGRAFGMEVLAWSQHLTAGRAIEAGATLVGKQELFERSDVVTLHLVLSERTRGIVGAAELGWMKPTAYLVNTSRGGLVDTEALLAALREDRIAGAGLDVFDTEPLPDADPLRTAPNLLATPHLGYVTDANYRTFYEHALEDIRAWLAGTPVRVLG